MIDINRQMDMFIRIARALPRKIEVFAIGGTSMMLQGYKLDTLDVDIVFRNKEDREVFKNAVESFGYKEMNPTEIYRSKPNVPIMVKIDDARFDLFLMDVIGVKFSDEMVRRAVQTHEFSKKLIIHPADIHDIIIMKSSTERAKDENDIVSLLKTGKIEWNILIDEAKNQISLGNEKAIIGLGYCLEKIKNKNLFNVPSNVLDSLWGILSEQVEKKKSKNNL